jgi:hypothetical protein
MAEVRAKLIRIECMFLGSIALKIQAGQPIPEDDLIYLNEQLSQITDRLMKQEATEEIVPKRVPEVVVPKKVVPKKVVPKKVVPKKVVPKKVVPKKVVVPNELISTVLYLLGYNGSVRFNYSTEEIVLHGIDHDMELIYTAVREMAEGDENTKKYMVDHFSPSPFWFESVVWPDVTDIVVTNRSGFNEDHRSHRFEEMGINTHTSKLIKVTKRDEDEDEITYEEFIAEGDGDEDDDEEEKRRDYDVYKIDKLTQVSPWNKHNSGGITWGDVMEGIMMAKGSKGDWHYELIISPTFNVKGHQLSIDFVCDHGS